MSRFIVFAVAALAAGAVSGCRSARASAGAPSAEARVERGKYLVNAIGCHDCHTPKKPAANGFELDTGRLLSGHPETDVMPAPPASTMPWGVTGSWDLTAWSGPWGVSYAANLTPDQNTGLGTWTEDMFVKAIRTGRHMGVSRQILPPMPWESFRTMTDDDLKAMFAYLRSLTPVHNRVPDPVPPAQTTDVARTEK